jgi:hypothetical protein
VPLGRSGISRDASVKLRMEESVSEVIVRSVALGSGEDSRIMGEGTAGFRRPQNAAVKRPAKDPIREERIHERLSWTPTVRKKRRCDERMRLS